MCICVIPRALLRYRLLPWASFFPPCVSNARVFPSILHLGWGGICLLSASNQGDDEVIRNLLQVKCGGGKRERGVHSTQVVYCKLFAELNLAVEQEHRQQAGSGHKAFSNAWLRCTLVVLSQILLSLGNLESNSIRFHGAVFQIYSYSGKKEKVYAQNGWVVEKFFVFLPLFSMRNQVGSSFYSASANWDKLEGRLTNYFNVMVAMLPFRLQKAFHYQPYFSQLPFNW